MKKLFVILFSVFTFLCYSSPVLADDEIRKLTVDLKAKGFTQSTFVDELKSTDINFGPNDKYQLQLRIINSGNRNQTNIKVRQIIPTFVSTDSNKEFIIPQIASGDTYTKNIVVTVKDKAFVNSKLTRGQITVSAISEIGTSSEDSLAFYVGNGSYTPNTSTVSAKILPQTGNSNLVLGSIFALSLLSISLYLRKLARGY